MKIRQTTRLFVMLSMAILGFMIMSCGENPMTNTIDKSVQGIPADQITWAAWQPEVLALANDPWARPRFGEDSKTVNPNSTKLVGGNSTLNNTVLVPAGAVNESVRITVSVLCLEDHTQCGPGADYLPGMQFAAPVKVTLSWAYLDGDPNLSNFQVYFSEDDGITWSLLDDPEIDYINHTISVWTDHFTRYAWGLD